MDNTEIKRILREQVEPLDRAVSKKLAYLQSDEVFTDDMAEEQIPQNDDSLLSAFSMTSQPAPVPQYKHPEIKEVVNNTQTNYRPRYIEKEPTSQSIEDHQQNIAAKIAALRGISMPGDYLRNKK